MKRTFVIILAAQAVLLLMFLVYAQVQRAKAMKMQEMALAAQMEAEKQANLAMINARKADEAVVAAEAARDELMKKLEECKKK